MIGPTTIWIRRMKASPSGCSAAPMSGQKWPTRDAGGDAEEDLEGQVLVKALAPRTGESASALASLGGVLYPCCMSPL
jgi:hypothetical protein